MNSENDVKEIASNGDGSEDIDSALALFPAGVIRKAGKKFGNRTEVINLTSSNNVG